MRTKHLGGFGLAGLLLAGTLVAASPDVRLVQAVKNRDLKTAQSLLKQGGRLDVNTPDAEGMTPLLWATHWDDQEMARLLLAAGANVKAANRFGSTPLHEASTFGDCAVMEALLEAGADANAARGEGDTPLIIAARVGSPEAVKLLLDHGAPVDSREGWYGETPLMIASAENYAALVKLLIDRGADVNAVSTAFSFRHRPMVDATTNIDPPMGGLTPLHFAVREDARDAAKVLIAAGAKLNVAEGDTRYTPLLTAVANNHYDMAELLVENGADVNDGSLFVTVFMRTEPTTERPFPENNRQATLNAIRLFLERGADPNAVFNRDFPGTYKYVKAPAGATPFLTAIDSFDLPAMQALAERDARPLPTRDGTTALMQLAQKGPDTKIVTGQPVSERLLEETIDFCLKNGIDVNATNANGNTAVHYAAAAGADHFIEYLAAHGAKLDVQNKRGESPLLWAQGKQMAAGGRGSGIYGARPAVAHEGTAVLIQKLLSSGVATR